METKKTTKANLEKTNTVNWLMSATVALALLFASFEWSTTNVSVFEYIPEPGGIDVLPPITLPEPPQPPPPPPAKVEVPVFINEVPDDAPDDGNVDLGTEANNEPSPTVPPEVDGFNEPEVPEDRIFERVETMPKFPGGDAAMMSFIAQSIKYPVTAIERGLDGKVICSFVIDKDGSITDAEVVRGIDVSLDKEALRVISLMPKWSPGMQRDKAVRVKYTLPITFRLQK